jgi:putative phosphoesterase
MPTVDRASSRSRVGCGRQPAAHVPGPVSGGADLGRTRATEALSYPGQVMLIGVISDTHGLLRPEALAALRGVDRIVHAGDIGGPELLASLGELAPVTAVRGNNDHGPWAERLPMTEVVDAAGVLLYVLHDLATLDVEPAEAGFRVVIAGHSHQPRQEERNGVLYFNPGSAGPRRFRLPIALGKLTIAAGNVEAEIVQLG